MCSLDCLSHEVNLLRPVNDAALTAPPTSLQFLVDTSLKSNKSCSFDCSQISLVRYATNSMLAYSIVGKHPWLVTSVLGVQQVFQGMDVQKQFMQDSVPATLVHKGPESYFLNFEHVCIPAKPPWSVVRLEDDSFPIKCASQNTWMVRFLLAVVMADLLLLSICSTTIFLLASYHDQATREHCSIRFSNTSHSG
jgi:hypothetical protein